MPKYEYAYVFAVHCFVEMNFYFSMPLPVTDSIVYYIDGNIYLYRI